MIGYYYASNNDLQHAGQETLIASSILQEVMEEDYTLMKKTSGKLLLFIQ